VLKPSYDAWVEVWTPGDTLDERGRADRQPYRLWVEQGFLRAPKGPSIRFDNVAQALAEYAHDFDIQALAYDRYAFRARLEPECHQLGLSLPFVEHPQGGTKRGRPMEGAARAIRADGRDVEGLWMPGSRRELEDAILEGRIRFRRNPVLMSAFMSALTDEDRWGNRWMAKERSLNKIDPAVAVCMALGAAAAGTGPPGIDVLAMIA
jgi:phage terminase large subunit-like protein